MQPDRRASRSGSGRIAGTTMTDRDTPVTALDHDDEAATAARSDEIDVETLARAMTDAIPRGYQVHLYPRAAADAIARKYARLRSEQGERTPRADFLDARIGGVVGDHTDRDRQELRALRWALDRLASSDDVAAWPTTAESRERNAASLARLASPDDVAGSGTRTDCSLEGVHEHAFRGPHTFREWEPGTTPDDVAGSGERLNVAMLASALSFAHPGPRPWPGALTSVEFARVVAREYDRIAAPTTEAPPKDASEGLLTEDRSDIRVVPEAAREMWNPDSRRNRKFRDR
jgi:hypothetical protein